MTDVDTIDIAQIIEDIDTTNTDTDTSLSLPTLTQMPTISSLPTDEFKKIIKEFIGDIKNTFPEYDGIISKWWDVSADETSVLYIYNYCMKVYPERLFEILYQNEELFSENTTYNTEFLPGISFKYIWSSNITNKTKETIWKYLQLIVISLISAIKDKNLFGDTSKLLETVDNCEFKTKLEETMENIQSLFTKDKSDSDTATEENNGDVSSKFNLPSPDNIQEHISGMLHGKLGDLAKEIAKETAESLSFGIDDEVTDPQEIFKKLFSNPTKLMELVKNVGSKLDTKMKSGEINETELFTEASQMMSKMKSIPGMDNIQNMISKMGMNIGGLSKANTGAGVKVDQNAVDQKIKKMSMKESMKKKMEERHLNKILNKAAAEMLQTTANAQQPQKAHTDDELVSMFNENTKKTNTKNKNKK